MPKKQTRAAQLARQIQAVTGLPYTRCLKMFEPSEGSWARLARELRATGLIEAADHLLAVDAVTTEASTWLSAGGEIERLFYYTDNKRVQRTYNACSDAADAALKRAGFDRLSYDSDAEVYHAAFLALSKAGTLPDGRTLARAALDVFADDPTWCSDVIRSKGRSPFTYDTAAGLTGPGTPTAVAARKAARAMARAAAVPFNGDEEWYEAAGIMVEVMWHAGEAAGLSPLEGRPNCQDHLRDFMDGEIPQR
ncbi:hypothetical protein [Streptomyces cinerochromogenes]|uniref:hypothetical protein n=1 Tax=Streptomyces cinerochromogenes TaxID=66422 RepID=UPI001670A708|nr:hypothetical protein [Streptomyces cinerochromogenes]GGT02746.1 hypothetical protein GCM10010206_76720 [Streptomyces cinerochromogenes]